MLAVLTNIQEPLLTYLISYNENSSCHGYITNEQGNEVSAMTNIIVLARNDGEIQEEHDFNCKHHEVFTLENGWQILFHSSAYNELFLTINKEFNNPNKWITVCNKYSGKLPLSTVFDIQSLQRTMREKCDWPIIAKYDEQIREYTYKEFNH